MANTDRQTGKMHACHGTEFFDQVNWDAHSGVCGKAAGVCQAHFVSFLSGGVRNAGRMLSSGWAVFIRDYTHLVEQCTE